MSNRLGVPIQFALIFVLVGMTAPAQVRSRTVTGTVTDKNGNLLPKSVVHLKNLATLDIQTFVIHEDGTFHFKELNPDVEYEIHAEYRGRVSKVVAISRFNSERNMSVKLIIPVE